MTYEQYWRDDPDLVIYYRNAYEDRKEYDALMAYLQGRYFYDALCLVSPLYNAFKPKKPKKFPNEPYPITKRMVDKQKEAKLQAEVARINAMIDKFEQARGEEDAGTESAN